MACTRSIEADLQNTDTFRQWVNRVNARLQTLSSSTDPTVEDINELVYTIAPDVKAHQDCISSQALSAANIVTDMSMKQSDLDNVKTTLKQRENDVKITHDRVKIARNPELTRSYYDGWFPINRPLKHYTIPILIALSIFFFVLSFLYFMNLFGIDLQMVVDVPIFRSGPLQTYGSKSLYTSTPFLIMTGISIFLLGLTIYGFTS
jgi:antibiotic biosynthesis monooxygenase (ABM) superfamily enzyme